MIRDISRIMLTDGSTKAAIDVFPGARIASDKKRKGVPVEDRVIEEKNETVSLMFSNGDSIEGSRDQKVYVWSPKVRYCKTMEQIELGERVVGWVSGLMTVLHVAGIRYHTDAPHRLVGFRTGQPYVADGVVVR